MTRRKVERALELALAGDVAEARRAVGDVPVNFLRKKLSSELGRADERGRSARAVWNAVGLTPPAPAEPDGADAQPAPADRSLPLDSPKRLLRLPPTLELEKPESFLANLRDVEAESVMVDLDELRTAQVWSLVGLATLIRHNGGPKVELVGSRYSPAARFAHAVGLQEVSRGVTPSQAAEPERTYPLTRVTRIEAIEQAASRISKLMVASDEESRRTLYYVLVELLRNVVQHSGDPLGGVVAAQRMDVGQGYSRPVIQVAVGDAGIGILASLQEHHPELAHPEAAVTKALEPHVSGTFSEGRSGSRYNAGMGLFFISEMAKLTAGRLVVATRGAALYLAGDVEGREGHDLRFIKPPGTGFPGTLVAFELPLAEVKDHESLIEVVRERAYTRTPKATSRRWLRLGAPPPGVPTFAVAHLVENTVEAEELATSELQRRILERSPVALDFRGIEVCTQSFLHSLLYETLRLAWAKQVEVYAVNAAPAVLSGLRLVDNYAISG